MLTDRLKQAAVRVMQQVSPSPWPGDGRRRVAIAADGGFDQAFWPVAVGTALPGADARHVLRVMDSRPALLAALADAEACIVTRPDALLLSAAPRLQWLHVLTAGLPADLPPRPAGLRVSSSRGIAAVAMAEHAIALLLALTHRLDEALWRQGRGEWSQAGLLGPSRTLSGRTLAVFGLGATGARVARLARGLGMQVIGVRHAAAPSPDCDEVASLDDRVGVLARADAVVLATALTPATRRLIGAAELAAMRRDALLVNVARGALVDEAALAAALKAGALGGAGLDVLAEEPPPAGHALAGAPRLIVTPHVAGNIHRFRDAIGARVARNLDAWDQGRALEGEVGVDDWPGGAA